MKALRYIVAIAATFASLMVSAQTTYKYNKPAGADNFYHTYSAKESQVSFLDQYKMKVAGTLFIPNSLKEGDKYLVDNKSH